MGPAPVFRSLAVRGRALNRDDGYGSLVRVRAITLDQPITRAIIGVAQKKQGENDAAERTDGTDTRLEGRLERRSWTTCEKIFQGIQLISNCTGSV
jgi:hypothetical protein